ncbi:carboxypeptidase-like regulatory domain-containing protein [Granulicella sp. L46]|uniref:carboxypeptidase-like regulatory domain-containing protein n=1 Tax=Granulicella sp. L46 TaxID=1641865 RepID=UPI0020B13BDE|nr:carboxypeptidase-like regulatory domain-containing protein [Granulicella sp. L46]
MKSSWSIFRVVAIAMAGILGLGSAYAQSTNAGDIRGLVTDPSGALIPGATVTVLNLDTGVAKDYPTNNDGLYDTNSVVAGSYKLTFTKTGFETYVRGPITVLVGTTDVNAQLKIGASSVEVTVNTDVPLLNTEDGSHSATLEAHDMEQMPNVGGSNGPDWQNFMILLPGATGTYTGTNTNQSNAFNPGQEVSTNGNLPFTNVLADGASTTLPSSQNANPAAFEDVSEVQVSLSSFSAQYGVGGLIMNQITRAAPTSSTAFCTSTSRTHR